ncbi:MAG: c-type cytochrome [Gallionella sp.]|nr:c-type cytochrome [Gallionella sp.]MDD4957740.1 c-type cytochrome [Gallionella sp.]
MKLAITLFVIVVISLVGCSTIGQKKVQSEVALPIAKRHSCMACHSVDKRVVGPSFTDIAAKYRGQNAEARLFNKVKSGGAGVWGSMPAPPMRHIPDDDVRLLVQWITEM